MNNRTAVNIYTAPECPTVSVANSHLVEELHATVTQLLADGFGVYYYRANDRVSRVTWFIVERDSDVGRGNNVGTVQYDRIAGYSVTFSIKPDRDAGSGLSVLADNYEPTHPTTTQALVLAAGLATQDTYKNFATALPLPNHGWKHFEWAKDRLTKVTANGEDYEGYACQHCGRPGGH